MIKNVRKIYLKVKINISEILANKILINKIVAAHFLIF